MLSIVKSSLMLPSQGVEPYGDIEAGIQAVLTFLHTTQDDDPDLSALAKRYEIPLQRLQARWEGYQSKQGN